MNRFASTGRPLAAVAVTLSLIRVTTSVAAAQTTTTFFDPPAAVVRVGTTVDYDVSTNRTPNGPRSAALAVPSGTPGQGRTLVHAVATLNGKRGFSVFAYTRSPSPTDRAQGGEAESAMAFLAQDPLNRDRVKVDIEYQTLADTGAPFLPGPGQPVDVPASTGFNLEIGRIGTYGRITRDGSGREFVDMPTVGGPVAPILEVSGIHIRNNGDPAPGFHELVLRNYGVELERKGGSGPLEYKQKITLDVPVNYVQLMTLSVFSITNGIAYVDPVVTANPDNPEVVVTTFGAVDPHPSPPVVSRAELVEVGIDPGPLEDLGIVDPAPVPSPSGVPSPVPSSTPMPVPASVAFVAPLPDAACKLGRAVSARFYVLDDAGAPVPDATAKALVKACRVQVGLDTATKCVRYDKRKDLFKATLKVPKETPLGAHAVVARIVDAAGDAAGEGSTAITVVPRVVRGRH